MLRLLMGLSLPALWAATTDAEARTLNARMARVATAVATLEQVQVRLSWPAQATEGALELRAARIQAPDLGYRFRDVVWRCPLKRDGRGGWRCEGELRGGAGKPLRLALDLGVASTDARLSQGGGALSLHRAAASPDLTRIELARVPLAWAQALVAQAWPEARLKAGTLDGHLDIAAPEHKPLSIAGPLRLSGGALDTPDGLTAAEKLGAQLQIDASLDRSDRVAIGGRLLGGEMLFGNAYVSLQQRPVDLRIEASQNPGEGWRLPRLSWRDGGILALDGSAALTPDASLAALDLNLDSADLAPLRDGYLSGFLGLAGLAKLELSGAMQARVRMSGGELQQAEANLHEVALKDDQGRFRFEGLDGSVAYSADAPRDSELSWREGALYGLGFGAVRLPFSSGAGELRLRRAVDFPMLGGRAGFDGLRLRPPSGGKGLDLRFGLNLERLDVGQLAKALDWPAFTGELSGRLPEAHYADDRLELNGGLTMQLFGGTVAVSSLAMERPFGVAPTLSSDLALESIDLESLTGVFGFGSITGRLFGRIEQLRLVDWQPTAFDAELHTRKARGVRQRISQRAVQDLSSVGDSSFVGSLQDKLIGFFDDFGYARLGISCRLADEVCHMDGLGTAKNDGFTIVQGSGVPHLDVVGYNRRVDWPTLLERLEAVSKGDVKPVVQ
ncbi:MULTISPECIES: YdbH domain-containing protein [Lysobacter]|uniref:YdbH domain-containing protein n=2 Tax=Lysobacteraceae TaxID=32033 RepID=UPI001F1AC53E|nr:MULTISPECIES: YdbH domain-containing protein [Lysobacter]UJB17512.1 YdbH domain-containing protein [Lysobacter capsici]UJQ28765.1 YdbH domain-containing protein [Lysobacter gummosus]